MKNLLLIAMFILGGCGGEGASKAPDGGLPSVPPTPPPVEPVPYTCSKTFTWRLTEDRTDLTHGTLYVGQVPNALGTELEFVAEVAPYALSWTLYDLSQGLRWVRMTVSAGGLESDYSNEVSHVC